MLLRTTILLVASFGLHAKCSATFEWPACDSPPAPSYVVAPRLQQPPQPRWMSTYRVAQFSLVGAAAADISSSWGCAEANPILRSSDGRFRTQGLAVKVGVTAGGLIATHLLRKKYPKLEKPLAFMMGGSSTLLYATAFRNHRQRCY